MRLNTLGSFARLKNTNSKKTPNAMANTRAPAKEMTNGCPKESRSINATKVESMAISPWAKLGTSEVL